MTTTGRRRDVAWGFFFTLMDERTLYTDDTKRGCQHTRRRCLANESPGPIFKITEPRTQIRAGRGGKRGRG